MWGRRADRPEGAPLSIDEQVRRGVPVLDEGMANVYTMPEGPDGKSRYVGTWDTFHHSEMLGEFQRNGYLVWSTTGREPVYA